MVAIGGQKWFAVPRSVRFLRLDDSRSISERLAPARNDSYDDNVLLMAAVD